MVHNFEKCTLLVLLLLFFSVVIHGRNSTLEQLHALTTSPVDSQQISSLIAISDYYNYLNSDSSLWYAQQAAELAAKTENKELRYLAQLRLASTYFHKGDFLLSIQYYHSATDLGFSIPNESFAAEALMYKGIVHSELAEMDSALTSMTHALEMADKNENYVLAARILNSFGELHRLMNDGPNAVVAYELSLSLFKKLGYPSEFFIGKNNWATVVNPSETVSHLIEKHQKELASKEREIYQQNETIIFSNQLLLFICLIGILISGIFYIKYTKALHLNEKHKLIQNELKTQLIQQKQGNQKKLLAIKSKYLSERKQLIDELKKRINQPKKRPNTSQSAFIQQLSNFSQKHSKQRWDWKSFQMQFDSLYKGYSASLKAQCPTLTPREVKICALMKTNLTDQEMASVLGLSITNFQKAKGKVEKKLIAVQNPMSYSNN